MENNAGLRFKYYFSSPVTVTITSSSLRVSAPFVGIMRVALLYSNRLPLLTATNSASVEAVYDANVGERVPPRPPRFILHPKRLPLCAFVLGDW